MNGDRLDRPSKHGAMCGIGATHHSQYGYLAGGFQHEQAPSQSVEDRLGMSQYVFLAVRPEERRKRVVGLQA